MPDKTILPVDLIHERSVCKFVTIQENISDLFYSVLKLESEVLILMVLYHKMKEYFYNSDHLYLYFLPAKQLFEYLNELPVLVLHYQVR